MCMQFHFFWRSLSNPKQQKNAKSQREANLTKIPNPCSFAHLLGQSRWRSCRRRFPFLRRRKSVERRDDKRLEKVVSNHQASGRRRPMRPRASGRSVVYLTRKLWSSRASVPREVASIQP